MKQFSLLLLAIFFALAGNAQLGKDKDSFTHQDTLRGSLRAERNWWNVTKYGIYVMPDYSAKTISGHVNLVFQYTGKSSSATMQIDLQEPMILDSAIHAGTSLALKREGNVYWVDTKSLSGKTGASDSIRLVYHGKPREAIRPPWDGGWIWTKDKEGRPWMSVACQGLGASVWYPCKDYQGDEPDAGAELTMRVADTLTAVGNGRLLKKTSNADHTIDWTWKVVNPINNYNIIPYIGKYVNWSETFKGEKGDLDCNYWVLDYDLEKSKQQFGRDVHKMLQCFEQWMGPYPFYEDGYKLVEAPHLGMEHQSAVAYGNRFMNGYLGSDLSGTGHGKTWDYIIVHESGHEWFANNITTNDLADMWIHEGFTSYSEVLFVDCQEGKQAGDEYAQGLRRSIRNKTTVIGPYGVNKEGSQDMYPKGANLLHTIREVINNDDLFKSILRGLNKDFYHKTVDSRDVERYISDKAKHNFSKLFDQYLRDTAIPVLEYKMEGRKLSYRWTNVIKGFDLPLRIGKISVTPKAEWQTMELPLNEDVSNISKNYYIVIKKVE